MTKGDIRAELVQDRFGPGQATRIDRWIDLRYSLVWADSEWPFKRVRREAWNVVSTQPTMPPAYWKTTRLDRPDGTEVAFLSPDDFDNAYPLGDSNAGAPENFTVINGQVILGPAISGASQLYHSYQRRPWHFNTSGTVVPGLMNLDTDYPAWPEDYHYILVLGATATGLKIQNDPTWDSLEQEFGTVLVSMREDLLPPDQYKNLQYGRDSF